jgi:hypothetical protein
MVNELSKQDEKEEGYRNKSGTEKVDEMTNSDQENDQGHEEEDKDSETEESSDESLVSIDNDEEKSLVSIDDNAFLVFTNDDDSDRRQWQVCARTQGGWRPLGVVWKYFLVYKDRKVKQSVCKACYQDRKNDLSCPPSSWEVNNGHLTTSLTSHLRRYHYESFLEIRDQLPVSQKEAEQLIAVKTDGTSSDGHEERRNWEVCEHSRTSRSPLRKYFLIYKDHEVHEFVCKFCYQNGKDKLSSPPSLWEVKHGNKTTNLNNHLKKFHPNLFAEVYPLIQRRQKRNIQSSQSKDSVKSKRAQQSEERRSLEVRESTQNANILIWNYFWEYKDKPGFAICRICHTEKKDLAHHSPSTWEFQARDKWRLETHLKHRHTQIYVEYCRKTNEASEQRRDWEVCEKTGHSTLASKYFYIYIDRDFKNGVCKTCYHEKKEEKTCSPDVWEVFPPYFEDHLERIHPPIYKQPCEQKKSGKQTIRNEEIKKVSQKESNPIDDDSEHRRHWEVCEKLKCRVDIYLEILLHL